MPDTEQKTNGTGGAPDMRALSQAELRAATTSELLQRIQFMRQAGITYGGLRDEYEILGYDRIVTNRQYRDEYARGGIAARIVDAMPNATWRGTMEIVEDQDPKNKTEIEKTWNALDVRLQIQAKLLRVDKLAGLSSYAVLLIGATGELETELPKATGPDALLYLTPFSGGGGPGGSSRSRVQAIDSDCTIDEFDVDVTSPRFGLPKSYRLKRTDITSPSLDKPVHWTRIIHVAENLLEDEVYGLPALERVWNLLCDLRKVTGGGAEAFWLRANQGLHIDVDKDMAPPDAAFAIAQLQEQSEAYKHQMTRWLRTKGTKVDVLGSDVANFESPADAILTQIAGSKAIPKRILTGSEMGELASSQDRDNWKDQVNGRQTGYAGPYIVRPLVDRLIKYGYLPIPKGGERAYEVRWPQIQTLTEQEKVEGAKGWADVNSTQGSIVFTDEEIRDKWAGMAPLTDEQKAAIEEAAAEKAKLAQEAMAQAAMPKPAAFPRAAEAGDEEILRVLETAIRVGNAEVVNRIVGLGDPDQPRDEKGQWTDDGGGQASRSSVTSEQYTKQKTRNEVRSFAKQKASDVAKKYTSAEVDALGGFKEERKEAERLAEVAAKEGGFPVHEAETFHYTFTDAVVSAWRTSKFRESMSPESRQRNEAWKKKVEEGK